MTKVETRLSAIEKKLDWITLWVEFFVKEYYGVNSLDEVSAIQGTLKKFPPLPEEPRGII